MSDRPFTNAAFNQFLAEGQLMGSRCQRCDRIYVPPRPLCPHCHSEQMAWVEMEGRARLVAYTTVHIGPKVMIEEGYDRENPYCSGIVELAEGPRVSARVLGVDAHDPGSIGIGIPLTIDLPERGEDEDGRIYVAFRPDEGS